MSEHQPYRIILREELRNCWDMIREQRRSEIPFDMDMNMNRIPSTGIPGLPSARSDDAGGKRPPGPNLVFRARDGYIYNQETGERKPQYGIVLPPPAWLLAWFEAHNIPWPLSGHYLRRVGTPGGHTIWQLYDEQGIVIQQYLIYNNRVWEIAGNWTYFATDDIGMPLFEVPAGPGLPFHISPLDESYQMFPGNTMPGVSWAIRLYPDGTWRADHDSDGNWDDPGWVGPQDQQVDPNVPGFPNGSNEENQGWFNGLTPNEQLLLVMGASVVIGGIIGALLGGLLGDWLNPDNNHQNGNSSPPVIPDDGPDGDGNPGDGNGDGNEGGGPGDPPGQ